MMESIEDQKNTKNNISGYIKSLDGIRGISCFFVMLVHFKFSKINCPSSIAYAALHCFFIMSAFLITRNLFKDKERADNFSECFKVFYIKRTARIFPVYFFYVFLMILLIIILKTGFNLDPFKAIDELKSYGWMILTFFYNLKFEVILHSANQEFFRGLLFPHLWSMALEEQFYFTIIFLVWFCNKKTLQIISILFILLIPVIRILGYIHMGTQTNDDLLRTLIILQSPHYQFDAFFYGIALAIFDFKKTKWYIVIFITSFVLIIAFNIVNAFLCAQQDSVSVFQALREDEYIYRNFGYVFLDSLVNIFCCAWILSVIYFPEKFTFFNKRIFTRFGELTYCLYIFQFIALLIGFFTGVFLNKFIHLPVFISEITGFAVYIYTAYLMSDFISKRVEIPFLVMKDEYLKKRRIKKSK